MPLCDMCKSEALIVGRSSERGHTQPPHGMEWGEQCDECGTVAKR